MPDKLRGVLIDPYVQLVTDIEVDPYPEWKKIIDCEYIEAVTFAVAPDGFRETCWVDEEFLLNESKNKGPWFKLQMHPQPMGGRGLILGTDQQGETVSTTLTAKVVTPFVTWPDVKFVGFEHPPARMENHPLFGEISVIEQRSVFEPADPKTPDETSEPSKSG